MGCSTAKNKFQRQKTWSCRSRERDRESVMEESWSRRASTASESSRSSITDEDLDELRGCIDLGFRFGVGPDPEGDHLCNTLPALNLYYAINKQLELMPLHQTGNNSQASACLRRSHSHAQSQARDPAELWKIPIKDENPQEMKTKLRQWARAVACWVRQSC